MYLRDEDGSVVDADDLYDYLGEEFFDNEIDEYHNSLIVNGIKYDASQILKVVDNAHYREIINDIIDRIITYPEEYGFVVK